MIVLTAVGDISLLWQAAGRARLHMLQNTHADLPVGQRHPRGFQRPPSEDSAPVRQSIHLFRPSRRVRDQGDFLNHARMDGVPAKGRAEIGQQPLPPDPIAFGIR